MCGVFSTYQQIVGKVEVKVSVEDQIFTALQQLLYLGLFLSPFLLITSFICEKFVEIHMLLVR